jgi:ubiquinone biosynthesis protein UbiJ
MITTPVVAFVNHLLEEEQWARDRLAPFAGKRVRVTASPLPDLAFEVREGGWLEVAPTDEPQPDLVVALEATALPALARGDDSALQTMTFSGDAELAAALQFLFRNLSWDVEEDLARVIGDLAAHRLVNSAREFLAWQKDAAARIGENLAEYLSEEAAMLAPRPELARYAREVAELRDAVERLEKRLERIDRGLTGGK